MSRLMPLEKTQSKNGVLRITSGRNKGKKLRLLGNKITIGRHNECDIVLKDNKSCSRKHALIIRKNNSYSIESLKEDNPVLVNNQPVKTPHILKEGDIVVLGDVNCVFAEQRPVPARLSQNGNIIKKPPPEAESLQQAKFRKKGKRGKPNPIVILGILGLLGFLLLSEEQEETAKQTMKIKTEKEVTEEMEAMQKINEEEEQEILKTAPSEGEARIAFIKGFRDYRKGYYLRAEKHFNHCLTLNKKYKICESYVRQSRNRMERIIQRKCCLERSIEKTVNTNPAPPPFNLLKLW